LQLGPQNLSYNESSLYLETTTESFKTPTANLGFTTIENWKEVSASACYVGSEPEIAIWGPKLEIFVSLEL